MFLFARYAPVLQLVLVVRSDIISVEVLASPVTKVAPGVSPHPPIAKPAISAII